MSEVEAARSLGMTTTELRARLTAAKADKRAGDVAIARQMRERGESYNAISERLGVSATNVRSMLSTETLKIGRAHV